MLPIAHLPAYTNPLQLKIENSPKPPKTKTLDILSLNTALLSSPFGSDQEVRAERIGSSLGEYSIIGLQETFSNDSKPILEQTKWSHHAYRQADGGFLKDSSGLTMLSKHKMLDTDFHEFSFSSGTDKLSRKGVIFTRIDVPGVGPIDIYNTHLQADADTASDIVNALSFASVLLSPALSLFGSSPPSPEAIRKTQIDEIADFVKKHDQGNPTFFTGDFNLVEGSDNYNHLLNTLGVKDSFDELHPNADGFSSPEDKKRFDYVFYRSGDKQTVKPISSELTHTEPIDGMKVSDHFGVHTSFEFIDK